jgi:hypothetical protein
MVSFSGEGLKNTKEKSPKTAVFPSLRGAAGDAAIQTGLLRLRLAMTRGGNAYFHGSIAA